MTRILFPFGALLVSATTTMVPTAGRGFLSHSVTVDGLTVPYQVYVPPTYSDQQKWPVILFLHGSGERGNDGVRQTGPGIGDAIRSDETRYPAIVVMPQAPADSSWTGVSAQAALAALDVVMRTYSTDPARVYLTGLSMGGKGVWYIAYRNPDRFAAIAPVCGWVSDVASLQYGAAVVPRADGAPFDAVAHKLAHVPVWIFHGADDPEVPVVESRQAYAALHNVGADVRYTEYAATGHNVWDQTYASADFSNWLFAQKRR